MTPTLWILLTVVLIALGAFVWFRRPATPPKLTLPPMTPGDELGSLGLSEVRPATAPRLERVSRPESPSKTTRPTSPPLRTQEASTAPISSVSEVRPKASAPGDAFIRSDSPLWPDNADAVRPLLRSLSVSLGGGVAVLRHENDAYAIDALIGVPGVRAPRPLQAGDHPLHRVPQDTVLTLLGPESRQTLRYYAEPEAAVGQAVARALAEPPARRVLLVADVPPGQEDLSDDALALIARYGDLLAALSDLDEDSDPTDNNAIISSRPTVSDAAEDVPGRATVKSDPGADEDTTRSTDDASASGDDALPRAVIIQRQIDAAQDADHPLAFALVTLAAADAVLRGNPERVATAEADLRNRIEGDVVRAVEPFGDLMLGAFLDATPDAALAWAAALADTEPPLLVGLVPSAMTNPEAIRAAATDALEEAYHQGGGLAVVGV